MLASNQGEYRVGLQSTKSLERPFHCLRWAALILIGVHRLPVFDCHVTLHLPGSKRQLPTHRCHGNDILNKPDRCLPSRSHGFGARICANGCGLLAYARCSQLRSQQPHSVHLHRQHLLKIDCVATGPKPHNVSNS